MQLEKLGDKPAFIVAIWLLFGSLVLAGFLHAYYLLDPTGGDLFSRKDEAYLVLPMSRDGFELRYLEIPFADVGHLLPWTIPKNGVFHAVGEIFRITPTSTTHSLIDYGYDREPHERTFLTPFDDGLYANCAGVICKWHPSGFAPATADEQRDHPFKDLAPGANNQVLNGWQLRTLDAMKSGERIEIEIGTAILSIENRSKEMRPKWIVVELRHPGQPSEVLYDVDAHARRVGRSEYERSIRKPSPVPPA